MWNHATGYQLEYIAVILRLPFVVDVWSMFLEKPFLEVILAKQVKKIDLRDVILSGVIHL